MKDYTVENLLWFRKYFPNVYHQLRNRQSDGSQVKLTTARNEQTNIEVYVGNDWVPLYSRYNPEQEVHRWAQQLQLDSEELILIGLGLGYHLKALLENHPEVKVHVFEPNEQILLAALQGGIFFDLPASRISSMAVGYSGNEEKFLQSVSRFFQPILNNLLHQKVELLFLPSYQRWFQKEIRIISEGFKKLVVSQRSELQTQVSFEQLWTLNALKNLSYTLKTPSAGVLKQKVQGHPLIIVSSGPSMEREVEVLKQYRNRAIILAAGSSVNGLVHHGIRPHAVISYDPAPPNKKVFDLLATHGVQIPFIFGTTIYHEILTDYQFQDLFHVIISQDTVTPFIYRRLGDVPDPILSDAPSVAIVALQLAVYWGANPIIFVGQDLAFPDNKYYASGVSHLRDQQLTDEELKQYFEVEKVGGGTVLTSHGLNRMRESMEAALKQFSNAAPDRLFINTSAQGARIHGTLEMPLSEAIQLYGTEEKDYDQWFRVDESQNDGKRCIVGMQHLDDLLAKQPELDDIVEKLTLINQRLKQNDKPGRLQKLFDRLDQNMGFLQKHLLFQTIYQPMMRTQLELYNRLASQVRDQSANQEKSRLIQVRLEGIMSAYHRLRNLLKQQYAALFDDEHTIDREKVTD